MSVVVGNIALISRLKGRAWFSGSDWPSQAADGMIRYQAKITGAADGLDDYAISGLRSFQSNLRQSAPSYLSIVAAYSAEAFAAIGARENGEIVVEMVAGATVEEFARATFQTKRYDIGSNAKSMTIVGYKSASFNPTAVIIAAASRARMQTDGTFKLTVHQPYFSIKPGDLVTYGDIEFEVDLAACSVSPGGQSMEISG